MIPVAHGRYNLMPMHSGGCLVPRVLRFVLLGAGVFCPVTGPRVEQEIELANTMSPITHFVETDFTSYFVTWEACVLVSASQQHTPHRTAQHSTGQESRGKRIPPQDE